MGTVQFRPVKAHGRFTHLIDTTSPALPDNDHLSDDALYARVADDLESRGYSICPASLSGDLTDALYRQQQAMDARRYFSAGIGRGGDYLQNEFVRTNGICWITGESSAGRQWQGWSSRLQGFLNRRLFLGLFSFESHFAHYAPGNYYKRHYDAFRGEANRILSVVVYLNPGWTTADGGELVLYKSDNDREGIRIVPLMGTLAVFLSEEFPHEVLPAKRDRYSIAGWFRVNTSTSNKVDPPA